MGKREKDSDRETGRGGTGLGGGSGGGAVAPGPPWPAGAPPLPEKFLVANMVVRMAPCKGGGGAG